MKQILCSHSGEKIILLLLIFLSSCHPKEEQMTLSGGIPKATLKLTEAQMQLANIKVSEVTTGTLGHRLLLTGVLKINEQSVVSISSGVKGRIQKLFFKNTGETVNKGVPLYEFYSEDLLALQREYKALQDNNWNFLGRSDKSIVLENKLLLMGMLPSQISHLKTSRNLVSIITIYSIHQGIIRSVNVTEGQYVEVGQKIYELADDSRIWVEAQVYPNELQSLSVGMAADVVVPIAGDLHLPNRISFINPAFEPGSNVTLIRAIINNPDKLLHPGMHALISVQTQKSEGIVIPASAVLNEKQGSVVWVQNEDRSFESRAVTTGIQSSDSVLVLSGLNESEKVVVSGVYLLNSEKILNQVIDNTADKDINSIEGQKEKL
jgi:Cu(I)/Ag(I) efflux system membrane fusion protein